MTGACIFPYYYYYCCYYYYYLTAIGLTPSGSSIHLHTQYTEYRARNTHNNYKGKKQLQGKKWEVNWEVRAVPRLCELYPGICLTTEEKSRKNLS
jgi:hypothetical protein